MTEEIWLKGYRRVDLGGDVAGGLYDEVVHPKLGWHTTEGESLTGARAAFRPYPPHLGYNPRTREREQYIPLNRHSYAYANGEADDEFIVQVEVVGFAAQSHTWSDQTLRNLAEDVVRPVRAAIGVPDRVIPNGFHGEGEGIILASTSSPIRVSLATLRAFSGHLGHQHIPGDAHWDPGRLPIGKILTFAGPTSGGPSAPPTTPEDNDMQLTDRMTNAWGGTPTMEEVFRYIDLRATEAAEGVARVETMVKALAGRPVGDVDEVALARELLMQGLAGHLGRLSPEDIVTLRKAVGDEVEHRQRVRLDVDLQQAEADHNGQ